jgi:hypothetical protein
MTKVIRISYCIFIMLIGLVGLPSSSGAENNEQIHRCEPSGGCDAGIPPTEDYYGSARQQHCSTKIEEEKRCCNNQHEEAGKGGGEGGCGCTSNSVMTPEQPRQTCCCKSEAVPHARSAESHCCGRATRTGGECEIREKCEDRNPCKCNGGDQANTGVHLQIGLVGSSVWDDGSVSLAISIENDGNRAAEKVQVVSVTFGFGSRKNPLILPVDLGEILSEGQAILKARFQMVNVPGTYTLTVSGLYTLQGYTYPFTAQSDVGVVRSTNGTSPTSTVIVPKHSTSGVPGLPSQIPQENDNNPAGPPIPDGPPLKPFSVTPTNTGVAPASNASGVTFVRDTGSGQPGNFPPDPTAAAGVSGDNVVLASGNSYVLFSTDDGVSFSRIDPTTIFPQSDGGLCCDQVLTYVPRVNLFFWLIQYKSAAPIPPVPAGSNLPGPNRLRIAWASPESMKSNINSWTYVDLQSSTFNLGNQALDFPDLAFTDGFLYASVDRATTTANVLGLIVTRISFQDITGPGPNVGIGYFSPNESTDQNTATGARLSQSSRDAMYWGGHIDSSHIKVFHWADSSNGVDRHDTQVNTWCQNDYSTLAPDNQQWLDNSRTSASSIIGATRKPFSGLVQPGQPIPDGEVWLAWGSGRDAPSASPACVQGRPQPYVKIVRVNDRTLDSVGEYHIWNTPYAFAYPALATDPSGNIGVSVTFGGPANFASTTVGYLGDFVVYFVESSDVTLTFTQTNSAGNVITNSSGVPVLFTRYGDYFTVRNSGPGNTDFSSQGYAVKLVDSTRSNNCTNAPGCNFRPHYEQWGRPPSPAPR